MVPQDDDAPKNPNAEKLGQSLNEIETEGLSPSQKVQLILDSLNDSSHESHPVFSEMEELFVNGEDMEWRETARWVKFEENVEEGGSRWSKPHVSSLPLHSLFELRRLILNGLVILDMEATTIEQITDLVLDHMIKTNRLPMVKKEKVRAVLLKKHRHQHQNGDGFSPLGCIGRLPKQKKHMMDENLKLYGSNSISLVKGPDKPEKQSFKSTDRKQSRSPQLNLDFMRKISPGSEANNILAGEVDFLDKPLSAFIRLSEASLLGDMTEVPVPTRFLFVLLWPKSSNLDVDYPGIGRAMATLMSDEIFREMAYKARNRYDLLAGIDEFLDVATVLPPGEWDPSIRIEPPSTSPSQDLRRRPTDKLMEVDEEEEEQKLREATGLARTGVLFGGLKNDLKRKAPWYWSDFRDALSTQCVASWIFLYFACLSPIITFGGLLGEATGKNMAAMESLVSGFLSGMAFGFFSGQPLAILGSTGPVLVFEKIVYDFCLRMGWEYMPFRFWIGTWIAITLLIMVATDASAFVCYITRFTEENFATLIAFIFIVEAVENVLHIGKQFPINTSGSLNYTSECSCFVNGSEQAEYPGISNWTSFNKDICATLNGTLVGSGCSTPHYAPNVFLMSIILFLGTFLISIQLKDFKNALFFPSKVRQFVSDFAVIIAIISMSFMDYYMNIPTPKLQVPNEFKPTLSTRGWIIPPFGSNPVWSVFVAIPPALLGSILIYMDQQISCVIVNRKENKLKKGCGYHLDLFVVAILTQICSIMGLPWFVAATVLSINHVNSLKMESECAAPGEKPQFLGVREQRVTHILIFLTIGVSVFLTPILGYIPMPVLFGVFLYMGIASLSGVQFFDRILIMFMPKKYQPDHDFLRQVPVNRVHIFTIIQLACLVALWLIKSFRSTSILFPLMLVVMIGVRKWLDLFFTRRELKILDDVMPKVSRDDRLLEQDVGFCGKIARFFLGPKLVMDRKNTYQPCAVNDKEIVA